MFVTAHLTPKEISMALTFIRHQETLLEPGKFPSPDHCHMERQILAAMDSRTDSVKVTLSHTAVKLLREYNGDYCCVLAEKLKEADLSESVIGARIFQDRILGYYHLANRLLAAFKQN